MNLLITTRVALIVHLRCSPWGGGLGPPLRSKIHHVDLAIFWRVFKISEKYILVDSSFHIPIQTNHPNLEIVISNNKTPMLA